MAPQKTVEVHFAEANPKYRAIYDELHPRIMAIGPGVEVSVVSSYIGYYSIINKKNTKSWRNSGKFAEVRVQVSKDRIRVFMRTMTYDDPQHLVESAKGYFKCSFSLTDRSKIDYLVGLLKARSEERRVGKECRSRW